MLDPDAFFGPRPAPTANRRNAEEVLRNMFLGTAMGLGLGLSFLMGWSLAKAHDRAKFEAEVKKELEQAVKIIED